MLDLSIFAQPDAWVALGTLTAMEIVLGIDNIVFLTILTGKLKAAEQPRARTVGLTLALVMRLGLLLAINWVMGLTEPLFSVLEWEFSGRDLILGIGGLFLVGKATQEIFEKMELLGGEEEETEGRPVASFAAVILQVVVLDAVFSLDSVITAVGMADHVIIMAIAMVIAVGIMLAFAGKIGDFVNAHPSLKVLALSFLILIGVMLVAEGLGEHINKGYIYFAMAFSLVVELINMRVRKRTRKQAYATPRQRG